MKMIDKKSKYIYRILDENNEIEIKEIIKKNIKKYQKYYILFDSVLKINGENKLIYKYDIIEKNNMIDIIKTKNIFYMIRKYLELLELSDKLLKIGVIHNNICDVNVSIKEDGELIIDGFEYSINVNNILNNELDCVPIKGIKENMIYRPVEYLIFDKMSKEKDMSLSLYEIEGLINNKIKDIYKKHKLLIKDEENEMIEKIINDRILNYKKFVNISVYELKKIIKESYKLWDVYSINILFLESIINNNKDVENVYIKELKNKLKYFLFSEIIKNIECIYDFSVIEIKINDVLRDVINKK